MLNPWVWANEKRRTSKNSWFRPWNHFQRTSHCTFPEHATPGCGRKGRWAEKRKLQHPTGCRLLVGSRFTCSPEPGEEPAESAGFFFHVWLVECPQTSANLSDRLDICWPFQLKLCKSLEVMHCIHCSSQMPCKRMQNHMFKLGMINDTLKDSLTWGQSFLTNFPTSIKGLQNWQWFSEATFSFNMIRSSSGPSWWKVGGEPADSCGNSLRGLFLGLDAPLCHYAHLRPKVSDTVPHYPVWKWAEIQLMEGYRRFQTPLPLTTS